MRTILGYGLMLASLGGSALAAPTEKDAVALAEKGAQFVKLHGREAMAARINAHDPALNQGALYLTMRDLNGITVAHPTTALIGKNLLDVPDADGKPFRQEMLALAKGKGRGWVDYKFRNPESGRVAAKSTVVLRVGDVALEAGIYKH